MTMVIDNDTAVGRRMALFQVSTRNISFQGPSHFTCSLTDQTQPMGTRGLQTHEPPEPKPWPLVLALGLSMQTIGLAHGGKHDELPLRLKWRRKRIWSPRPDLLDWMSPSGWNL